MLKILFLLLSGAKLGKLLTTGGSMLLSIGVYALLYGWRFAAGFVGLLFVHEMGHFIAARQRGLPVGWPTFIPFMGAWIELKQMPHNAETEAYVGLGGPLLGTLGALVVYVFARNEGSGLLLALAYSGFFLNLFNLIPLSPLDGGRITQVISPRLWLLGMPVLGAVFLWRPSPLLVLVAVLAGLQLWQGWKRRDDQALQAYHASTTLPTRLGYGAVYVMLLAFLAVMCFELHEQLQAGATQAG
jgi:Zn-dependent protease